MSRVKEFFNSSSSSSSYGECNPCNVPVQQQPCATPNQVPLDATIQVADDCEYDTRTEYRTCTRQVPHQVPVKVSKTIYVDKEVPSCRYETVKKMVPCKKNVMQQVQVPCTTYEMRPVQVPSFKYETQQCQVPCTKTVVCTKEVPDKKIVCKQVKVPCTKTVMKPVEVACTKEVMKCVDVPSTKLDGLISLDFSILNRKNRFSIDFFFFFYIHQISKNLIKFLSHPSNTKKKSNAPKPSKCPNRLKSAIP